MGCKYFFGTILAAIVNVLNFLLKPILWPVKKIRERRDWKNAKGFDLEMNEILRVHRFEEANPRADEDQAAELRQAWYKVRREEPTWIFIPGVTKAERGQSDNSTRCPMVRQHAWLAVPFVALPLECTPVPERISLQLQALPRLDTSQPQTKQARPRQDVNVQDRRANTSPCSERKVGPEPFQAPKKVMPKAPTRRWGDEWPGSKSSPVQTMFFRRMVKGMEGFQELPNPHTESWFDVDID